MQAKAALVRSVDPVALTKVSTNYAGQKRLLRDFFVEFSQTSTGKGQGRGKALVAHEYPYKAAIDALNSGTSLFKLRLDDVLLHFGQDEGFQFSTQDPSKGTELLNTLLKNTQRGVQLVYEVVEELRRDAAGHDRPADRLREGFADADKLPMWCRVPYECHLVPPSKAKPVPIHQLRAEHVGALTKVQGIVCKVTNVRPRLLIATYQCRTCQNFTYDYVDGPTFTPASNCEGISCQRARVFNTLTLNVRFSKFIRRQEVRIQELPHLVPAGSVPRQIKVVLLGEMTRVVKPGMACTIGGVLMPQLESGFRRPHARASFPTVFEGQWVQSHASIGSINAMATASEPVTEDSITRIIRNTPDLYEKMAASLAPAIHGHDDVKKALLLQLVGGSSGDLGSGLKIRGDIHVLLMGDPGIAKSQLLLRVCSIAPRAHFTCGKGSSGVGLTASVVKDQITGEFTLEAGAIVLADNGVCCVDEFDKMDESDRTAIHEVMEQQSVSISKAGLVATLNARTTVLAAANPVFGRYDLTKSAVANIGLPAALLSRFDIVFLMLDEGGAYDKDVAMARHLLQVHKDMKISQINTYDGHTFKPFSAEEMRILIRRAQSTNPKLTPEVASIIVETYVQMRQQEAANRSMGEDNTYVTPRTLFGLLRLSQAIARLRFRNEIIKEDFEEALRLIKASRESVVRGRAGANYQVAGVGSGERELILEAIQTCRHRAEKRKQHFIQLREVMNEVAGSQLVEEVVQDFIRAGQASWKGPEKDAFAFVRCPSQAQKNSGRCL